MNRSRLCLLLLAVSTSVLMAASPSWWVLSGTAENYAPANIGQLKFMAKEAKAHLDWNLLHGSGTTVNAMVATFVSATTPEDIAANYAPLNIGQLKAVAKPFYDRLIASGYDTRANLEAHGLTGWTHDYPWDPAAQAAQISENYAPANLGQLKLVFSFDLTGFDTEPNGLPDAWEEAYFEYSGVDPEDDPDGDGYSNLEEFQQGTNPTDYYSQGGREVMPVISIIGGNNQSGPAGQYLPDALEVAVWASDTGETLTNAPVTFSTLRGGTGLSETKGLVSATSTVEVYSGSDGIAKVHARPANTGVSVVQASAAGEPVEFSINNEDIPTEGLKVWLKADVGVTVQGQQVVSWQDQSGDSRTATQSTDAQQPVLISEGINGKPSVRFDGVNDSLGGSLGYNGGSVDLTIITVHRRTGSTIWGAPVSLSSSQYGTPILTWKNTGWELGANNVGHNDTGVYVNSGSASRGRYLLSSVSRAGGTNGNGGTLSVRSFDGKTALAASGTQTWSSGTTSGYYLGRHWSADPSTSLKGEVAEVLIYNRALTDDEKEQVEWYLRDKYALDDSDEDGMQDGWETQYGLDPYFADDAEEDADGDGLTNLQEFQQGSDPTNRYDGVSYNLEINDGNNQSGTGYLGDPLEVVVSGSGSVGIEGANVTFRVTSGPGEIAIENPGDLEDELEVPTDENGLARVHLNVTGTAVVTVRAEAGAQSVEFVANAPTSGMKMWLRADTGITGSNGRVSQWTDQSGNAMPAGNTYAPQQPTLVENAVHGKPAVRFDGVDDVLTGTTTYNPSGGDFTILAVHRRSAVSEWAAPFSFSTSWTSLGAPLLTYKYSESNFGVSNVGQSPDGVYVNAGTMGLNRFSVASLTRSGGTSGNGGTLNLRMSNGPVTLTSSGTQTWTSGTATGFALGRHYISGPTLLKGDVAELIVYNRVLTSGELAQMEDYLQTKYALRDSDTDGMADWWEEQHGLEVGANDATLDADCDGINNLQEFLQNGDPQDYYNRGSAGTAVTPTLSIDSGNNQTGLINQFLQKPLVVKVTGTGTTPLVNAPVTFKVTNGGGAVAANPGPTTAATLTVQTGSTGLAQIFYRQGTEKSVGNTVVATTGTSSVTFQTYTSADDKGLVGKWRFDEGTGLSVADESAFVNSGTLGSNGPIFGAAINSGSSLEFDSAGNDDVYVVDGPNTGVLNFGKGSFSLSFWFKSDDAGHGRLVGNGAWGGIKGYSVKLTRNASHQYGKLGFYITSSGTNVASAADMGVTTLNTFNDNEWHHVAAVVNREQGRVTMYVDGVSQEFDPGMSTGTGLALSSGVAGADISAMSTLQADSGERMRFGQFGVGGDPYEGLLDEVQVYGKALTQAEIQELFERDGSLEAIEQEVTVPEDTLGTIVIRHRGGGDQGTATYTIVEEPENGAAELEGDTVKYYPNGHFSGTDAFRFRVTKNGDTSEADINLTISPVNDAPLVSVGGGQSITLPAVANLTGTITDIDTDPEDISVFWMKISGPGTVTFSAVNDLTTTATFSAAGQYVLQLSATDGTSTRSDSLVVVVNGTGSSDLPTISLEEPANETSYEYEEEIVLKVDAAAGSGLSVSKVEFFEGSRKIGEVTKPDGTSGLYELNWIPVRLGAYTISALVTDSAGKKTTSDSITIIVSKNGWFGGGTPSPGNEGNSGSGGNGGMSPGSSTGTGGSHGPGSGAPGGGGNPENESDPEYADSDEDGLSDAEEDRIGTNKHSKHSDSDGVPDGEDGWALNENLSPKRVSETAYAVIPASDLGIEGSLLDINNKGSILTSSEDTYSILSGGSISTVIAGESGRLAEDDTVVVQTDDGIFVWTATGGRAHLPEYLANIPNGSDEKEITISTGAIVNAGEIYTNYKAYGEVYLPDTDPSRGDEFLAEGVLKWVGTTPSEVNPFFKGSLTWDVDEGFYDSSSVNKSPDTYLGFIPYKANSSGNLLAHSIYYEVPDQSGGVWAPDLWFIDAKEELMLVSEGGRVLLGSSVPGTSSTKKVYATGISESDESSRSYIVGQIENYDDEAIPTPLLIWQCETQQLVYESNGSKEKIFSSHSNSMEFDINSSCEIVGSFYSEKLGEFGHLIKNGRLVDINEFSEEWDIEDIWAINDAGVILGRGKPEGSGGEEVPVVLVPFEVVPNPIPVGGVTRAKIVFGSGIEMPEDISNIKIKIGKESASYIHRDEIRKNVIYFTPPKIIKKGEYDIEIRGIEVDGIPVDRHGSFKISKFVRYTNDAEGGMMAFSDSNIVRAEESESLVTDKIDKESISNVDAAALFCTLCDMQASTQMGLFKAFFRGRSLPEGGLENMQGRISKIIERIDRKWPITPGFIPSPDYAEGVYVKASQGTAIEGGTVGKFEVVRPVVSSSSLTVNYTLSGSAINGVDYSILAGSVTIPAHESSVEIIVSAIADADNDPEEVILTLSESGSYDVGFYDVAKVVIMDELTSARMPSHSNFSLLRRVSNPAAEGEEPPPLGTQQFFPEVRKKLQRSTKKILLGGATYNAPLSTQSDPIYYLAFDARDFQLKTHVVGVAGKTISDVVSAHPEASIILNGAQCNFGCTHPWQMILNKIFSVEVSETEPLQTIGRVIDNGTVVSPTSTSSSKASWKMASQRWWFGQSVFRTREDNGTSAASYLFGGEGHPVGVSDGIGGLVSLIVNGKRQTVKDDVDLGTYGLFHIYGLKPRLPSMGGLVGFNVIGVDRDTGIIVIISKQDKTFFPLEKVSEILANSGVDWALVTDGGGSTACWASDYGFLSKSERHQNPPDESNTITNYLLFIPYE